MHRRLSYELKQRFNPILIKRDGFQCFFCKVAFSELIPAEYDHLNNDTTDNRLENWVFCCHPCNNKKKFNPEMQMIALEKLKENERSVFVGERTGAYEDTLSEQEISKINKGIAKNFIQEHTINNESLILKDAINAIVNLCNDNNETGSQSAIYRYVESWCNPYNGFLIKEKNPDGVWIIRRR